LCLPIVSTRDLAPTGVGPQDQEPSSDLVSTGTGFKLTLHKLKTTTSGSSQNVPSVPTNFTPQVKEARNLSQFLTGNLYFT